MTNNLGERGIKILEDYTKILTENLEERQMMLQCMKKSRRDRPNFKKAALAGSSS